jgi:hypothetical protein
MSNAPGRPLLTRDQFKTLRRLRATWGRDEDDRTVGDVIPLIWRGSASTSATTGRLAGWCSSAGLAA